MNILTINLLFSTIVFWVAARIYVLPKLSELRPQTVLLPILLLHSFRHLGLMFLLQEPRTPAFLHSLHIPRHSAISLPRCWRWLRFRLWPKGSEVIGFLCGRLTWRARWI